MELLAPNEIKQEKSDIIHQAQIRTQKLSNEEANLVLSVNIKREEFKKEIEKIDKETAEYRAEKEREKTLLNQEVMKLAEEKKELLKPIDEIKKRAEDKLNEANIFTENLKEEKEKFESYKESELDKIQEDAENNRDKLQELEEKESELDKRDKNIAKEELRIKESTGKLAENWKNYDISAENINKRVIIIGEMEELIKTREIAVETRQKEQDLREIELGNEKRGIADGYATLAKSQREILGK